MKLLREVITKRIRCPHCGGAGHRVYRTDLDGVTGDVKRYARCKLCGKSFHLIETDRVETISIPPQRGKLRGQQFLPCRSVML